MSTFIVSSDWHIGAPMNSAGCAAESFKEKKYEAVSQILKVIKEKKAKQKLYNVITNLIALVISITKWANNK